jgi:FkbM family methyltransferase
MAVKDTCAVFVSVGDYKPALELLKSAGFVSVNQIYNYDMATAQFLETCSTDEVLTGLCEAYKLLSDERSVKVFDSIVNRVFDPDSNIDSMADIREGDQYFPSDIVKLTRHESFVDAGAFDGDSVKDIVKHTQGEFDRIFSFELDAVNFKALQRTVGQLPERDRVETFNLGVWDRTCDISYNISKTQSVVGVGEARGYAAPLDEALKNKTVTFIKMDVEGSELKALHGARKIIAAQKPKLAICVYHHFKHLWEIPLYMKELVPEYRIYLRHHTMLEYETVCYAVL